METIRKGKYEGYLWWSNSTKPEVLIDKEFEELVLDENTLPFIIEGQLYEKTSKTSYSIRYIDGNYYVVMTEISADDLLKGDVKHFLSHRMDGIGRLVFIQYWDVAEDTDNLCEGMPTQVPGKLVFCGFEQKEESK